MADTSLKERILEISVDFAYKDLISSTLSKKHNKIHLFGANQEDKIKFMTKLYEKFRHHKISIHTQKINSSYPVKVFGDEKDLAFLFKEDFYSRKRNCSIVVEGGTEKQRECFINYLIPLVDVFVYSKRDFPDCENEYVIPLDEFNY